MTPQCSTVATMRRPHPILRCRAHPVATDVTIAVVLTILTMVAVATSGSLDNVRRPDAWAFGLGVVTMLPIAGRRLHPVPALWAVVAAQIAFDARNYSGAGWLGVLIMLYTVAGRVEAPARQWHAGAVVAAATVSAALPTPDWGAFVFTLGILPSAFILGDNVRRRRERYRRPRGSSGTSRT